MTEKRAKYRNKKAEVDGHKFDSKLEAERYKKLKIMQYAGLISNLQMQVNYELLPKQEGERKVTYIADFVYQQNGQTIVEDVKGRVLPVFILKRKMMLFFHGIKIQEITK